MELLYLIIWVASLLGLGIFQHYKIKHLEEKTKVQNDLLNSIKTYFEIMNPDLLKFRVETYEKTLEAQKTIEIDKIKQEMSQQLEKQTKTFEPVMRQFMEGVAEVLMRSFSVMPQKIREGVIAEIQSPIFRNIVENPLFTSFLENTDKRLAELQQEVRRKALTQALRINSEPK
jgi:hypothetical protein